MRLPFVPYLQQLSSKHEQIATILSHHCLSIWLYSKRRMAFREQAAASPSRSRLAWQRSVSIHGMYPDEGDHDVPCSQSATALRFLRLRGSRLKQGMAASRRAEIDRSRDRWKVCRKSSGSVQKWQCQKLPIKAFTRCFFTPAVDRLIPGY